MKLIIVQSVLMVIIFQVKPMLFVANANNYNNVNNVQIYQAYVKFVFKDIFQMKILIVKFVQIIAYSVNIIIKKKFAKGKFKIFF